MADHERKGFLAEYLESRHELLQRLDVHQVASRFHLMKLYLSFISCMAFWQS